MQPAEILQKLHKYEPTDYQGVISVESKTYTEFISKTKRTNYLEQKEINATDRILKTGKNLLFLPNKSKLTNGNGHSSILEITGTLVDGRRIMVKVLNIHPFTDIKVPEGQSSNKFEEEIRKLVSGYLVPGKPFELHKSKPFKYYQSHTNDYFRMYFKTNKSRLEANNILDKQYNGLLATNDTRADYIIFREKRLAVSTLLNVKKFTQVIRDYSDRNSDCSPRYWHDPIEINCSLDDVTNASDFEKNEYIVDKSMCLSWDIETYNGRINSNSLPEPANDLDRIITIGMSFHWTSRHSKNGSDFLKVCLSTYQTTERDGILSIVCPNEKSMIKTFGDIVSVIKPEFIVGFNDGSYDAPWLESRAAKYDLTVYLYNALSLTYKVYDDMKLLFAHQEKIDATTTETINYFNITGLTHIDIRQTFKKLYITSNESSLKFYLKECNLTPKDPLSIPVMFKIFESYRYHTNASLRKGEKPLTNPFPNATVEVIKEYCSLINNYCVTDCTTVIELLQKRNIILDKREIAALSYVDLDNAIYRADGNRVKNLTLSYASLPMFNLKANMSRKEDNDQEHIKYTGAYVFPPKCKLYVPKLSAKEKHPELTNDQLDTVHNYIENMYDNTLDNKSTELLSTDNKLYEIAKTVYNTENSRPISGLDFSSLYPSLMRAYNLSPEYCVKETDIDKYRSKHEIKEITFEFGTKKIDAKFVWHDNQYDINSKDFKFGIYAYIANTLFNKRAEFKKQLGRIKKILEFRSLKSNAEAYKNYLNEHSTDLITETPEESELSTEQMQFQKTYLDVKQNAIKIFMNSFYGEAGNQKSPFFMIEVSGGITSFGQQSIKFAESITINELGCVVCYGDTDSLYIHLDHNVYKDIDKAYYTGKITKLDYCTQLVQKTFDILPSIKNYVNAKFEQLTKCKFLTMAYEEVLYPVQLCAKKTYYGIAHEDVVNFKPKKLFIRGISIKKRGVSPFLVDVFSEVMFKCCDINNTMTPLEIAYDTLRTVYTKTYELSKFVQVATYKEHKNNIRVQNFVKRMKSRGHTILDGDKVEYIIAKSNKVNCFGNNVNAKVSDLMELYDLEKGIGLTTDVDRNHYIGKSLLKQFVTIVSYLYLSTTDYTNSTYDIIKSKADKDAESNLKHFMKTLEEGQSMSDNERKLRRKNTRAFYKSNAAILHLIKGGKSILTEQVNEFIRQNNTLKDELNVSVRSTFSKYSTNKALLNFFRDKIEESRVIIAGIVEEVSKSNLYGSIIDHYTTEFSREFNKDNPDIKMSDHMSKLNEFVARHAYHEILISVYLDIITLANTPVDHTEYQVNRHLLKAKKLK